MRQTYATEKKRLLMTLLGIPCFRQDGNGAAPTTRVGLFLRATRSCCIRPSTIAGAEHLQVTY